MGWTENWLNRQALKVVNGMKSSWMPLSSRVSPYWGQFFSGSSFLPWLMGQHILSKSAGDTELRGVAAKAIVSCHYSVIPWQAGEMGSQDPMKFNRRKCHILHLGRNDPRHPERLEANWLESPFAGKDMVVLVNTTCKNHPEQRAQPTHEGSQWHPALQRKLPAHGERWSSGLNPCHGQGNFYMWLQNR